jgi:tryptophanyl-tRNA synthetase
VGDATRIFSGIQPTGRKHLGNYIGAIRQYVEGQDRGEAIYCVVDLHATTVPFDPAELRRQIHDTAAILLAAGLDPSRCIFFRQGDVSEHTELCWLLCSVTAWGDLNRMHQWKDKRELLESRQGAFVSAGLFFYPVLQAADVLAYRADEVPVGDDQRQHIELMREIARRFNERFGDTLVVPDHRIPEVGARIMDLQRPDSKMSTTGGAEQGTVLVLDEPDVVRKKIRSAVTDSGSEVRRGEGKEGISNLIEILAVVRGVEPDEIEREFKGSGYGADEDALERVLAEGAEKAREICMPVLADVRAAMGVGPRG